MPQPIAPAICRGQNAYFQHRSSPESGERRMKVLMAKLRADEVKAETIGRKRMEFPETSNIEAQGEMGDRYENTWLWPPFFEVSTAARLARSKAVNDAFQQWSWETEVAAADEELKGAAYIARRSYDYDHFDERYSHNPDYIDQYYESLEHFTPPPPFPKAGEEVSEAVAPAYYLQRIFPALFSADGSHVGLFEAGAAGGHHVLTKAAYPRWAWKRML